MKFYSCNSECGIYHAKMAKPIELLLRIVSGVGPRNCVLDGHACWSHLVNMVEQLYFE